jgi:glycine C-acetyltransferase
MVDDAHASGVFGTNGRGTIDHFGVHGRVNIQVGTLSKAIGVIGGYVAGTRALVDFLYHRARPFLFSTSHPPAVAAACIAAIDVLEQEPQIIDRLWDNTRFFKTGLEALGFNTGVSRSPITPVIVGEGALAMTLSDRLFQQGVFAQGIAFPTVARRASGPSSPPLTPANSSSSRSTSSDGSAGSWESSKDPSRPLAACVRVTS